MEIPEKQNGKVTPFEPLVDSRTAAPALGVHYKTLERMARRGEVPGFKIGRSWSFRLSLLSTCCDRKMLANLKQRAGEESKKENPANEQHAERSSNRKPPPRNPR